MLRCCRFVLASLLLIVTSAPAASGAVVDQGSVGANLGRCLSQQAVDSTCILPFGQAATVDSAVTRLAVGAIDPANVLVLRPDATAPGRWTATAASANPAQWRERPGTSGDGTIIDTAIPLPAGARLALVNPLVGAGSTSELDLPAGQSSYEGQLADGASVPLQAVGSASIEPDADRDGWGDESADLCPGVAGPICAAANLRATLDVPVWAPSLLPVTARWSVTNAGDAPQPAWINWWARPGADTFTGPNGLTCAPGRTLDVGERAVPKASRSALLGARLEAAAPTGRSLVTGRTFFYETLPPDGEWRTCFVGVLTPGATVGGTIGGNGWTRFRQSYPGFALDAIAAFGVPVYGKIEQGAFVTRRATVVRTAADRPLNAYAARYVKVGPVMGAGSVVVKVTCYAPDAATPCPIRAQLRSSIGAKVLATMPVQQVAPGAEATLQLTVTRAGKRWLAAHPKTKTVRAVVTTTFANEYPIASSTAVPLIRSNAFRRELRAYVPRRSAR